MDAVTVNFAFHRDVPLAVPLAVRHTVLKMPVDSELINALH